MKNIFYRYNLVIALFLSACSLAPQYQRPAAPIPSKWEAAENEEKKVAENPFSWQEFIADEELQTLVEKALLNNRDMRKAILTIEEVRAKYAIIDATKYPKINLVASDSATHYSDNSGDNAGASESDYSVGLALPAYEVDLFGRVKSLSAAALEEYFASKETARAVQLSLLTEVVQTYLQRAGAYERYVITAETVKNRELSLYLLKESRQVGVASEMDYLEALTLLQQAKASLRSAHLQLVKTENSLRLLTGAYKLPEAKLLASHYFSRDLLPGLSSRLLEQRPDIRAAEHTLRAKNANIGAAKAAFYPQISLTGQYGFASSDLGNLFSSGSLGWSFAPKLVLPIFDAGANQANLDLATVRKDIAIAEYEKSIQTAFKEVADALAAREYLYKEQLARHALVETSSHSLRLSRARYEHGEDNHLRYLSAQRTYFTNQLNEVTTKVNYQVALVDLFRALGGGWQKEFASF